MKRLFLPMACAGVMLATLPVAHAQRHDPNTFEFIMNSLFLLVCGILVMFMAAGFAMLEAGSVRARSVVTILIKNISLYALAGLMFYFVGYNLMFDVVSGGVVGSLSLWVPDNAVAGSGETLPAFADNAFWFFQMVFVATAASVVSGSLAERIRLWPFLLFVAILASVIYPVVGSWTWGGGWLASLGFSDFAGSTIVHSVGGWAALAGAILLGPRAGRFNKHGLGLTMPYASAPQIAIGVFILWFGWFGFNGGSQLSFSSTEDAIAVANILANTNAAAAGGVLATLVLSSFLKGKPDILLTLNGALAGLVSITAEPSMPSIGVSALIGAGGGLVMIAGTKLLEQCRIDDVVGAIPVHLMAGIYGTVIAGMTNSNADLGIQLLGIGTIGVFTFATSFVIWSLIKFIIGLRLNKDAEDMGADLSETGMRAYHMDFPEFPSMTTATGQGVAK